MAKPVLLYHFGWPSGCGQPQQQGDWGAHMPHAPSAEMLEHHMHSHPLAAQLQLQQVPAMTMIKSLSADWPAMWLVTTVISRVSGTFELLSVGFYSLFSIHIQVYDSELQHHTLLD